jgi:hypothetical protein
MRRLLGCLALVALAACPTYDRYDKLADQKGMMSADQFAAYGPEQAQKIAIGRALGQAYDGKSTADFAAQMGVAVAYAKTMPDVVDVRADTLAYFLTVQFKSGWRVFVLPISDGKAPGDTPGLPKATG